MVVDRDQMWIPSLIFFLLFTQSNCLYRLKSLKRLFLKKNLKKKFFLAQKSCVETANK